MFPLHLDCLPCERFHIYLKTKIYTKMRKALLLLAWLTIPSLWASAQNAKITGTVIDARDNTPIPNATIKIKGGKNTTTASDGTFQLDSPKDEVTVEVSSVGFVPMDMKIKRGGSNSISLAVDVKNLNEIVVTGVGTATSRKKIAISIQSVTADQLPKTPSASLDQALVGKIAGAQISSSSGSPGSPVSIQLRGINTIQGGSQPMILVDGVELGASALNTIDLNTVDKVEVIQGAAAGTIYGAQGANGVIQIFTKKGKPGPAHIEASSRVSWDNYINKGDVSQAHNHSFQVDAAGDIVQQDASGNLVKLVQDNVGLYGNPIWLSGPNDQNNKPYKNNTAFYDHFQQLYRSAQTTNHSISINGAKDRMDYALSVSQLKQESILDGYLKRSNFTTNLGFELFKNFKIRSVNQLVLTESTIGNEDISAALYTYPFADFDFKDADGNHTYKFGGAGANSTNPLYYRQYRKFNDNIVDLIPSINLNYKLPRFLELDYKYNINQTRNDYEVTAANQSQNKSSKQNNYNVGSYIYQRALNQFVQYTDLKGSITNTISRFTSQNSIATATLKFDFENDFHLHAPITSTTTAAYDWRQKKYQSTASAYVGLPLFAANANQAATKILDNVYQEKLITFGYFLNQRFDFGDYGGVSAGLRSDYSSLFGDTKKLQNFPRGDAYIRPSSFNFWNGVSSWFPEFKIRGSYGEAGIQPLFGDRDITLNNQGFDNGTAFYNQSQVSNPLLIVERSKELEVGTDITLQVGKKEWFSSMNLSATYWNRKGKDVIFIVPLAISTGASTLKTNAIDLSSKGFEFLLNTSIYKSKKISWDAITTFGTTKSFTDRIYGAPDIPLVWSSAATYTLRPGEQIGTIYGYKALTSLDQTNPAGTPYIALADRKNFEIVDGRVVETASKRVQFTPDKYVLGNTSPKFTMSFTHTINYKDFLTFSFQFDWIAKSLQYNQTKEWMYSEGLHKDFDKPVTIGGKTGNWTAYYRSFYDASESNGTKDYFLENSSFVRLRNASIGVDIAKLTKIPYANRLQLTFSGRNLLTFTKYTGMDPESNVNSFGAGNGANGASGGSTTTTQTTVQKGLDYFAFPNTRSFQVGINIGIN